LCGEAHSVAASLADPHWDDAWDDDACDHIHDIAGRLSRKIAELRGYLHVLPTDGMPGAVVDPAEYHGEGVVKVDCDTLSLNDREGYVIEALLERGALKKDELSRASGCENAPSILKGIQRKYPKLATYIILPGGKGKGGYRTGIKDARPPAPK
jgi:hypothetical protein